VTFDLQQSPKLSRFKGKTLGMPKQLDPLDIQILEAVGMCGPRNVSRIARHITTPIPTVRDRISYLKSQFSLLLQAKVYHTFIGLKKAFVFARASPGRERLLWESMTANEYWLYLTARYDAAESFYGIYGIPVDHTAEFEQFIRQTQKLAIAQSATLFWSTCIHEVPLTGNWYDHESETWVFKWDQWVEDIENQGTSLPHTLIEPRSYPQRADEVDIFILKELEKDATCPLHRIAESLGVGNQKVHYHFENHVIGKGLIEGYVVHLPHFEDVSESYCFRFNFHDEKGMAKFALSLENKPFVRSIGKIIGRNALFVNIYLPRKEFRGFTDSLAKLIKNGLLEEYNYAVEDLTRRQAETIPYQSFKDKSWIYNHEEHMKKLHAVSKRL
jgi:DNA-binding Lrp family transcriptional regulator